MCAWLGSVCLYPAYLFIIIQMDMRNKFCCWVKISLTTGRTKNTLLSTRLRPSLSSIEATNRYTTKPDIG